jgi:hypothetical protein
LHGHPQWPQTDVPGATEITFEQTWRHGRGRGRRQRVQVLQLLPAGDSGPARQRGVRGAGAGRVAGVGEPGLAHATRVGRPVGVPARPLLNLGEGGAVTLGCHGLSSNSSRDSPHQTGWGGAAVVVAIVAAPPSSGRARNFGPPYAAAAAAVGLAGGPGCGAGVATCCTSVRSRRSPRCTRGGTAIGGGTPRVWICKRIDVRGGVRPYELVLAINTYF